MKKRIGIIGGGQLGRMLTLAANSMGFSVVILDPTPNSPAGQVASEQIVANLNDEKAIRELAKKSDYLTLEWELADSQILSQLEKEGVVINPSSQTLEIIKDKLMQKKFLQKHSIPVAPFYVVTTKENVMTIAKKIGYPFFLKTRFGAYDGKGNLLINEENDIRKAMEKMKGKPLYIEKYINFKKEISVIAARDMKGLITTYPIGENIHKNSILHTTIVPAKISKAIEKNAIQLAKKTMKYLYGAGVFGIEMFIDSENKIFINEIAPRVHNSGHYTIEASLTSQFEQQIRAIAALPLGSTALKVKAVAMTNILGERDGEVNVIGMEKVLTISGVSIHMYGKNQTKIERKMGHITAVGLSRKDVLQKVIKAKKYITV